ncbi:hypothetical protein [Tritonibacter mobilis]|uniref:hypothetical protein n=1 Tax=Tritonibacter mobilis TaxID=379347 RepID=UPI001403D4E5|nr:hypothetical protein [Tritonibacter mobilis]NHM19779.1 hypothetical protein [Tritonibacter mobilis]NHM23928.1 hypothetical protein [Tritonibacter mobilis]
MKTLKTFRNSEDGAVSVDWVVLTAAIAALCALTAHFMNDEIFASLGVLVADLKTIIANTRG